MTESRTMPTNPLHVGGVFPHLAVKAEMLPVRTETGIGALMPWAGRLWMITYPSSKKGSGDWHVYETIRVPPAGYRPHVFPDGFSAHWVRVTASADCTATAWFTYT